MASPLAAASTLTLLFFLLPTAAQPPATQHSCSGRLLLLLPCLPYVQGTAATPPPTCCHGLTALFLSQPDCACTTLDRAAAFPINQTLARQLPLACNLAGSNSVCTGGGVPPSPGPTPAPSPAAGEYSGGGATCLAAENPDCASVSLFICAVCPSGVISRNHQPSAAHHTAAPVAALSILAAALLSAI